MDLDGRRVLITGASRGIGEALARRFAERGAGVALVARSADVINVLAKDLDGSAHPADLSDSGQVATLIERVENEAGPIDVLVNNAGIDMVGSIERTSAGDLSRIYQVNLITPAELCRQVIPRMLQRGSGHIVNVSSLAGTAVFPGIVAYSSTKAGLTQFTAGLRADLKYQPVGTTVVELGPIPTEMLSHAGDYRPTEASFERMYRLRLLTKVRKERVAQEVVEAVERGKRHVRIPRRAVLFPMLTEAPRRLTELLLTGVPHRA